MEQRAEPQVADEKKDKKEEEKEVTIVDVAGDAEKARLPHVMSFNVTWKNPETGVIKTGTFTATRPGLGTLGKIGVLRAKLNGGQAVDSMTDSNHTMMADLHFVLTDFPDWWRPDEFFTAAPLWEVWNHVNEWLRTFRPRSAG